MRAFVGLLLVGLVSVSGCSGPADGPLEFDEYGHTLAAQDTPAYFAVPLCFKGEPEAVTFGSVEAVKVTGTSSPVTFRVAWPYGPPFKRDTAGFGPVPAAYVPVDDAAGEVGSCGAERFRYGALAVVLPSTGSERVSVQDVRVTYEVSDRSFTEVVDVSLTQCPDGAGPAGTAADSCAPMRASR